MVRMHTAMLTALLLHGLIVLERSLVHCLARGRPVNASDPTFQGNEQAAVHES